MRKGMVGRTDRPGLSRPARTNVPAPVFATITSTPKGVASDVRLV